MDLVICSFSCDIDLADSGFKTVLVAEHSLCFFAVELWSVQPVSKRIQ